MSGGSLLFQFEPEATLASLGVASTQPRPLDIGITSSRNWTLWRICHGPFTARVGHEVLRPARVGEDGQLVLLALGHVDDGDL